MNSFDFDRYSAHGEIYIVGKGSSKGVDVALKVGEFSLQGVFGNSSEADFIGDQYEIGIVAEQIMQLFGNVLESDVYVIVAFHQPVGGEKSKAVEQNRSAGGDGWIAHMQGFFYSGPFRAPTLLMDVDSSAEFIVPNMRCSDINRIRAIPEGELLCKSAFARSLPPCH